MPATTNGFAAALGRLAGELPRLDAGGIGLALGRLRMAATAEGLAPAAELADGLAASLLRDRAGTPLDTWIEAIRHAAACPADATTAPLLLATIGVRLAH